MQIVRLSTIYRPVHADLAIQVIHSDSAASYYHVRTTGRVRYKFLKNSFLALPEKPRNPCNQSPCGPNSQCREVNGQAVCSCLPEYIGSPPGCRPECVVSPECPLMKACINLKCVDPCPGTCGLNAKCQVINHSPICSCPPEYTGDPFTSCFPIPRKIIVISNHVLIRQRIFF